MNRSNSDNGLSLEEELHQHYSADRLEDLFHLYLKKFLNAHPVLLKDWNLNYKEFEGLSIRKKEIVRLFAIICSDKELFLSWFGDLPFLPSKILESIVWEGRQLLSDLNKRTKGNIFDSLEESPDLNAIRQDYCLFIVIRIPFKFPDKKPLVYFDIPTSLRRKLKQHLPFPKGYDLKPLKSPEQTEYTYADRGRILESLPIALEFIRQGKLQCNKSGSPHKRSLNRLNQMTNLSEFFPDRSETGLKAMRTRMVAELLLVKSEFEKTDDLPGLIKSLFLQLSESDGSFYLRFMEGIKGWYHASGQLKQDFHTGYLQLLRQLPIDKWISISQLARYALVRDMDLCPVNDQAYQHLFHSGEWSGWGNTRNPIYPDEYANVITLPLLKSAFYLFAAMGLTDIMYQSPDTAKPAESRHYSDFCGLRYVKLNELGAFVAGKTDEYLSYTRTQPPTKMYLDEHRLILSLDSGNPGLEMKLEQIADRIGKNRFRFDFSSFFSDCSHSGDVENKLAIFHETIREDLPSIWRQFLDEVEQRTTAFRKTDDYVIVKIDHNNRDLIELIENDHEIRNWILLIEDYHIAIPKMNLERLKQRLINFGYLFS